MKAMLATLQRVFATYLGWKRLGIVASAAVITLACLHLYRTLKTINMGTVIGALTDISPHQIGLAAMCVVGAFFTLTFYDLFALRTIGKAKVPYRVAAMASFTSYTIGHNLGATVFTGGAIRFRIYSDWGLTAIDVAKICFLSGLTFWLGNAFVLGIGMGYHPEAASLIDQLPASMNRLIAVALIAGIVGYLVWLMLGERKLGRDGWTVRLPPAPLTLLQIIIGVVDLGFCAMAMYLLIPTAPAVDFMTLAVVFILSTLIGFASHAPGSLGVFDAAMLIGLPQFTHEQMLASLLVFRVLYFLLPFAISVTIMGVRELWLNVVKPWQLRRNAVPAVVTNVEPLPFDRKRRSRG